MKMKIILISAVAIVLLFTVTLIPKDREGATSFSKPTKLGDIAVMDINNIQLPMQNDGRTGLDGNGFYPAGSGLSFLFSGGFATSAYVRVNGERQLRVSWMATASLLEEWIPGKWGMDPTDPLAKFYIIDASNPDVNENGVPDVVEWADAVSLGADFIDVDNDGEYTPFVDRPDMIGDRIIWTVFNDNTVRSYPGGLGTQPIGLEIHQHVWAFARSDFLGDVIFFRYRLINPPQLDRDIEDLIFTVWQDPDLGDYQDDMIGSDTVFALPGVGEVRSLGYIYNDGADQQYGENPPAFGIDFFQGPVVEGTPEDTAFRFKGPFLGIDTLYGMKNLGMTSFMYYIQGGAILRDPSQPKIARFYQEGGLDAEGNPIDPLMFGTGGTPDTDPRFIFSGDPVAGTGWRDGNPADKRFMVNCGPFQLASGDTQDIVVGYIVAQGTNALNSVTKLRETDIVAQTAYDVNFDVAGPPPPPRVSARTFDKKIELVIDLHADSSYFYDRTDKLLNRQVFEALRVYQFRSTNTGDFVGGQQNARVIAEFDIDNKYGDLYVKLADGSVQKVWSAQSNIDTVKFRDPGSQIIKLTITTDAFNDNLPLINGKEYYFGVTAHSINVNMAEPYDATPIPDDWLLSGPADFLGSARGGAFIAATSGATESAPFKGIVAGYAGPPYRQDIHEGGVYVDVVDRDKLTGHEYEVTFFDNGNMWTLRDVTESRIPFVVSGRDTQYIDSMAAQLESPDQWSAPIVDGISVKVVNVPDAPDSAIVTIDRSDTNNVVWLRGAGADGQLSENTAVLDRGIDFVKNSHRSAITTFAEKERYFPIKVVIDTTETSMGHNYFINWSRLHPDTLNEIPLRAYDMSDPDNPRQVNVSFVSIPGQLNFQGTEVIIMDSDYDGRARYLGIPAQDSLFKAEAYMIMDLRPRAGLTPFSNPIEIDIKPYYPNSDVDVFIIQSEQLQPIISTNERRDLLDKVKVVPNPYFAYSSYENSYDTPRLKFIHLDRKATIRIFNLGGQLVKTLRKDDDTSELSWDLRNEAKLKIASGMYIAHIEVPGVGEKIIKFGVVQREERIDRY